MDSRQIELRLRMAAPDEPAVLPPLALPTFDRLGRVASTVRIRRGAANPAGNRLVYAVVALVLLMLTVIVAGALRIIDNPLERPGGACGDVVVVFNTCFTMTWPDDWHELAAGELFPGDFTEEGIAYERVKLVVASIEIPSCDAPGGPPPTSYESGGVNYVPRETADPGLVCLRTAPLPDGAIRITVAAGNRSLGLAAPDGPATPDTTEPSVEAGWTEQVDGRPARLTITTGTAATGTALETRTWDVLVPNGIELVLRVRADIAGPDLAAGRAAVQTVVESIEFEAEQETLDAGAVTDVLESTLDGLDRDTRQNGSDYYGCFPREPGERAGTISSGPSVQLPGPVDVTCRTEIQASAAGIWRLRLEMNWPSGDGYSAGGRIDEFFVSGSGTLSGGHSWLADGVTMPMEGEEAMLPLAPRQLPPLLTAPLNISIGSVVEMLPPGQAPADQPNPADEVLYPYLIGEHYYVVDGPRIVGGDEWYEVQGPDGQLTLTQWARGTFHGRAMLAVVEPACPTEPLELDRLVTLTAPERLACLGGAEVTFDQVIAADIPPPGTRYCYFGLDDATDCPIPVGTPGWLTRDAGLKLFGPGGVDGPAPGLEVWLDPSIGSLPTGEWLTVHGHFDDIEASTCQWALENGAALTPFRADLQVLVCRERFVITGIVPASAP